MKHESPQEVAGAAQALRQQMLAFNKPDYKIADSCGTGGSGKHTLNISTLVSIIGAAGGLKMVKHGNRSISSQCGSADVLENLNVDISMSPQVARKCLDETGVTFLFAPQYHPSVKNVMPVRNALKTRTIFNLLGPLINPAKPEFQLMGVYDKSYCQAAAESLKLSGCESAMIVHSEGCDEITLAGTTYASFLKNNTIQSLQLTPEDFGLKQVPLSSLLGGTPQENTQAFINVLKGQASTEIIDVVSANAGALFYITEKAKDLKSGVNLAKEIIYSQKAMQTLNHFAEVSQLNKG